LQYNVNYLTWMHGNYEQKLQNCLTLMLDYKVVQIRKLTMKRANL